MLLLFTVLIKCIINFTYVYYFNFVNHIRIIIFFFEKKKETLTYITMYHLPLSKFM